MADEKVPEPASERVVEIGDSAEMQPLILQPSASRHLATESGAQPAASPSASRVPFIRIDRSGPRPVMIVDATAGGFTPDADISSPVDHDVELVLQPNRMVVFQNVVCHGVLKLGAGIRAAIVRGSITSLCMKPESVLFANEKVLSGCRLSLAPGSTLFVTRDGVRGVEPSTWPIVHYIAPGRYEACLPRIVDRQTAASAMARYGCLSQPSGQTVVYEDIGTLDIPLVVDPGRTAAFVKGEISSVTADTGSTLFINEEVCAADEIHVKIGGVVHITAGGTAGVPPELWHRIKTIAPQFKDVLSYMTLFLVLLLWVVVLVSAPRGH